MCRIWDFQEALACSKCTPSFSSATFYPEFCRRLRPPCAVSRTLRKHWLLLSTTLPLCNLIY